MKAIIGTLLAVLVIFADQASSDRASSIDDRVIKVNSVAKVEATRAALIEYIWGSPWAAVASKQPNGVQHNYAPEADDSLPTQLENLKSIDRIDTSTSESVKNGATRTVPSTVFILYPAGVNVHRAVIVHQGHGCEMVDTGDRGLHVEVAIRDLLTAGYTVAAMRMPLFQSPAHCGVTRVHDQLMETTLQQGSPLKFFLEPIARTINYLIKQHADLKEVDMIGLSGGGWTTTVYAAIDPRVRKSFPVAGTLPLYLRVGKYNHDLEQYFTPFYQVAGYKDLYVLGAEGKDRLQVQILNRYDSCCFGERQHKLASTPYIEAIREYERDVRHALQQLPAGSFTVELDESAHYHQIPVQAIERFILPVLAGAAPPAQ